MEAPAAPSADLARDLDPGSLHHLVSALVDQLAAGQVETLYSLHSAAASVRQQAAALHAAVTTPVETLAAAGRAVQQAQFELTASHATLDEGRTALQSVADRLGKDLADQVTAQVVAQVQAEVAQVAEAQVAMTLSRIASEMEGLASSFERWQQGIDQAGGILVDAFAAHVEAFFAQLQRDLTRREARDASREKALSARVQLLADRSEAMVADLTSRLSEETDLLLRRDEEQELARSDAFVAVLETLLTKVGGRRQLRARVRAVVHTERSLPDSEISAPIAVEPPPPPPPPPPAAAPTKKTPTKKAVAAKPVGRKPAAKGAEVSARSQRSPGTPSGSTASTPKKAPSRKKDVR